MERYRRWVTCKRTEEKHMKKFIGWLLIGTSFLAGCVAVEPAYRSDYRGGYSYRDRDRDHDGVPNRYDRAPDNPRRY
jgi:hypothetical protein